MKSPRGMPANLRDVIATACACVCGERARATNGAVELVAKSTWKKQRETGMSSSQRHSGCDGVHVCV